MHNADEARTRYDRQVRLWGKQTQQVLQSTDIAIYGALNGTVVEVAKNLCLSGVRSILMSESGSRDRARCSAKDHESNHFIRQADVASHALKVRVISERLADLNPHVVVKEIPNERDSIADVLGHHESYSTAPLFIILDIPAREMSSAVKTLHDIDDFFCRTDKSARAPEVTRMVVVVVVLRAGWATCGWFLQRKAGHGVADQFQRHLDEANKRPRPYQLVALLALYWLGWENKAGEPPFSASLKHLVSLRTERSLSQVMDKDIQTALDVIYSQGMHTEGPQESIIDASISGGFLAQQVVTRVGALMSDCTVESQPSTASGRKDGTNCDDDDVCEDRGVSDRRRTKDALNEKPKVYSWYAVGIRLGEDMECFVGD